MSLTHTITLRTRIIKQFEHIIPNNSSISSNAPIHHLNNFETYIFYVYYGLIITNLMLSTFSEKYTDYISEKNVLNSNNKQSRVNLMSYLTFWWTNSLIRIGFKRVLTQEDLYEIDETQKSAAITNRMYKEWNAKTTVYLERLKLNEENFFNPKKKPIYKSNEPKENLIELNLVSNGTIELQKIKKISEPSLTICLMRLFGLQFLSIVTLKISHDILSFARPILLDKLINFIKDKEQKNYIGYFYIFVLCLASFSQTLMMQHYQQAVFLIGQQIKIGLQNLIYRKSLKLSAMARKETTVGEMVSKKNHK